MTDLDLLVHYALSFVGKPYVWGGEGPDGYDCSGLVQEILRAAGMDPPGDQSAQMLHDHFLEMGVRQPPGAGCVAFYGQGLKTVSHVAFCISKNLIVEAGGGGKLTTLGTPGAMVRLRPVLHRPDFVASYRPPYRLPQ